MGVSIADLPEPLRHAVLPWPSALWGIAISLLVIAALLQHVAPRPSLQRGQLAGLALVLALAGLPWLASLLWLPLLWVGVTWAGLLCCLPEATVADATPSRATPQRPAGSWLQQGVAADGLFALACAVFFWGQAGTWSRAGAGFVTDVPPSQIAASEQPSEQPSELPTPQLTLYQSPDRSGAHDDEAPPRWSKALHNKRFLGVPLDWVVLGLFLVALSLKLNMGLRRLRAGLATGLATGQGHGALRRVLWLLPALACPLLALQLWLQLRGQW